MEERKTIFDYIGQVFFIFGFSMAVLNIFCLLFGEDAKEFSSMFSLGKEGLSITTMAQYFVVSILIVMARFLFFTDVVIKNMRVAVRTFCMLMSVIGIIVLFIICFDWFPAHMFLPWFMFFVCFGICFAGSLAVTVLREKAENKKMEEALAKLKQQDNGEGEAV